MCKSKKGFTLAEILITLVIIGVIAALTVPSLSQNIQDAQNKAAWKEGYAVINQAMIKMVADHGGSLNGLCDDNDSNCIRNIFSNYVSYNIIANRGSSEGNCWAINWQYLNGGNDTWIRDICSCIALSNGMLLTFGWHSSDGSYNMGVGPTGTIRGYGYINTDINGFKGPNVFGKDIFQSYILNDGIIKPAGIPGSGTDMNTCDSSHRGWSCAYEYLKQ